MSPQLPSEAEPLNAVASKAGLSPASIDEGKSNPAHRAGVPNRLRVPVVDVEGKPLMPCTQVRARLLLRFMVPSGNGDWSEASNN